MTTLMHSQTIRWMGEGTISSDTSGEYRIGEGLTRRNRIATGPALPRCSGWSCGKARNVVLKIHKADQISGVVDCTIYAIDASTTDLTEAGELITLNWDNMLKASLDETDIDIVPRIYPHRGSNPTKPRRTREEIKRRLAEWQKAPVRSRGRRIDSATDDHLLRALREMDSDEEVPSFNGPITITPDAAARLHGEENA